jgi:uncharacterized protein
MAAWLQRHPLAGFALLAYAFSWLAALPLIGAHQGWWSTRPPAHWEVLVACGPLFAVLLVVRITGGAAGLRAFVRRCLDWRMDNRTVLFGVVSPVAILALAILVTGLATGTWPRWNDAVMAAPLAWLAGTLAAAASGPGEEPGWRGFLLPGLQSRHGAFRATCLLTLVWVPWHLPMFFYREGLGPLQFVAFAVALFFGAIWLTSLYNLSGGSIAAAVAWHAVWNAASMTGRSLEPSPFPVMGVLVALGAIAIVIVWKTGTLAPRGSRRIIAAPS